MCCCYSNLFITVGIVKNILVDLRQPRYKRARTVWCLLYNMRFVTFVELFKC